MTVQESRFSHSPRALAVLVLAILLAGLSLRVAGLGELPNGLFCDEAATGYDAFSLLETGRSLYGERFPLLMSHHGIDYVEGMYTYLTIPSVLLFGLGPFSVRLAAALAGTLTLLTVFLLTRRLFDEVSGVAAAALVAVSPWHLMFSRIAFRGVLLPLFLTLGVYLFLRAVDERRSLIPAALTLGLALHTYSVAKVLIPAVLLALAWFYRTELREWLSTRPRAIGRALAAVLVFAALAAPIYYLSFFGTANLRFQSLSILNHPAPLSRFVLSYLLQLNPLFLFVEGDLNPREDIGSIGLVLPVLIPLLLVGLAGASRPGGRSYRLMVVFFLVGSIPPALTIGGVPHALRGIGAVPYLEVIAAAAGVATARVWMARSSSFRAAKIALLALPVVVNTGVVVTAYFGRYPITSPYGFQYGMKEAVQFAERHKPDYGWIAFSPRINQAYVFPLFFARIHPREQDWPGHAAGYVFLARPTKRFWQGRHLVVLLDCEEILGVESRELHSIRGPDGEPFLRLLEVDLPEPSWVGVGKRRACLREPPMLADGRVRELTKAAYGKAWALFGLEPIEEPTPWEWDR